MKQKRGGRPRKYKTQAERIAAINASKKKYEKKNKPILREYHREYNKERYRKKRAKEGFKVKEYLKKNIDIPNPEIVERICALETLVNDIMLDHEEVLKGNKKLENLIKWGKR